MDNKNKNLSNLDVSQLQRMVIDAENDAYRIVFAKGFQASIELDAEDSDSVLSLPESFEIKAGEEQDCKRMRLLCLYSKDACKVEVSPVDSGDVWVELHSLPKSDTLQIVSLSVVAKRIRLVCAPNAQAYLLGQS